MRIRDVCACAGQAGREMGCELSRKFRIEFASACDERAFHFVGCR